jgi:hypothetical protein
MALGPGPIRYVVVAVAVASGAFMVRSGDAVSEKQVLLSW